MGMAFDDKMSMLDKHMAINIFNPQHLHSSAVPRSLLGGDYKCCCA